MKYIQIYEDFIQNDITCYHASKTKNINIFDLDKAFDEAIFGKAIYFSSQPLHNFGEYIGKYKIVLDKPLNINKEISNEYATVLLSKFNTQNGLELDIDFSEYGDVIQYGSFFEALDSLSPIPQYRHLYKEFIQSLGYNSFYHYCNEFSDFEYHSTGAGLCYGIYNVKDIKSIGEYLVSPK